MDVWLAVGLTSIVLTPIIVAFLFLGHLRLSRQVAQLEARLEALSAPLKPKKPSAKAAAAHVPEPATLTADAPEPAKVGVPAISRKSPPKHRPSPAGQNRLIVMRADRLAALGHWLRENWVYAVSAVSLALAGIFLVQYGIEKGLLPPLARVLAALALGAALIVAGEWVRRRFGDRGATTHLPATFSGAGIVALFGGILAARQLYGLIGVETAMVGLVAVAALAIVLGWFNGPFLAAVGLIGATAAPFAVGGDSPTPYWLYAYFAVITFAGLAVDAMRRWAWISVLVLVLGFGGAALLFSGTGGPVWYAIMLVTLVLLSIATPTRSLWPVHDGPTVLESVLRNGAGGWPGFPVRLAAGAMIVATLILADLQVTNSTESLSVFACLTILALAVMLWAGRAPALADLALVPVAGFLFTLIREGGGYAPLAREFSRAAISLRAPETAPPMTVTLLLGLATILTLAAARRSLAARDNPALWAAAAALIAPVAVLLLELFWSPASVLGVYLWALHAMALAALMVALAVTFARVDGENRRRVAYATLATLSLVAFALMLILTEAALTLALGALLVTATALDRRFRLPEMNLFVMAGVLTLGWRLIINPGLDWALDAPLWEVVLAFIGTLAALVAALWLLHDMPRRTARVFLESGLAGFSAIFANAMILRWIDSMLVPDPWSHWALSLNAMPWLVVMLVQLYRLQLGSVLHWVRLALALVAALIAGTGLASAVLFANPLYGGHVSGPLVFNTLMVAYVLPALLLLVGRHYLGHLPKLGREVMLVLGVGLLTLYAGLEIRHFWQGDVLSHPHVTQPELYTYTVAMMLTGAVLLYQAIARRSPGLRRLAMGVIVLTVAKVFLIDASGLSGLTRVFSFLLLGLSLAGLAWLNRWAAGQQTPPDKDAKA